MHSSVALLPTILWAALLIKSSTFSFTLPKVDQGQNRSFSVGDLAGDLGDAEFSGEASGDVTDYVKAGGAIGSGSGRLPFLKFNAESLIDSSTVRAVIQQTRSALAETRDLEVPEVMQVVSIIEKATQVSAIPQETAQGVLDIVDALSDLKTGGLQKAGTAGHLANRLIRCVDDLGQRVELGDSASARLLSRNTAIHIWDLSRASAEDSLPLGLHLRTREEEEEEERGEDSGGLGLNAEDVETVVEDGHIMSKDTEVAITLPASFLNGLIEDTPGEEVRLWMTVFSDTSLFTQSEDQVVANTSEPQATEVNRSQISSLGRLNSKVISASVLANGRPVSSFPASVVTSVFLPVVTIPDKKRAQLSRCVFWDIQAREGGGGWSTDGCRYHSTRHGRDVCVCDHLTNFAVLMDMYGQSGEPSQEHRMVLSLMSVVGLSLSICGLSCTVLAFLCIKKQHSVLPKQVLFNLALAMLLSWVVFLAGFTRRPGSDAGCLAVAALLHYLVLSSFLWMLVEGVMQYLLLVRVHGAIRGFIIKAALTAWGLPLIPVMTTLAVDVNLYRGYDRYCWLSRQPFYWGFLCPVGLVMAVNLVIYVLVVVSICRLKSPGTHAAPSSAKGRGVNVRASFACFVVLGLSWTLAFLAVSDARVVFQYVFTATTSCQGLLLFLLFTARDPLVKEFCRDSIHRGLSLVRPSTKSSRTAQGSSRSSRGSRSARAKRQEHSL